MVGLAISQSAIEHSKSMHQKPDPDAIHPIVGYDKEIYVKPTIRNPNTVVGDFTYIADSEFESYATHHCELLDGGLIICRFCQIAAGVEFVMNGANHQMNAVSTYPSFTLEGREMKKIFRSRVPPSSETMLGLGRTLSSCQACMLGTAQSSVQAALSKAMSRLIRLWSGIPPGHFANVSTTNL